MSTSLSPRTRWIQLLLGVICMIVISSPQYVWALFTQPLTTGLGASLPQLQITFSILIVVQTFLSPWQGVLVDRFGPRLLLSIGVALSGFSWVLAAQVSTLPMLYLTYGLLGGIGTGIVYVGVVAGLFVVAQMCDAIVISRSGSRSCSLGSDIANTEPAAPAAGSSGVTAPVKSTSWLRPADAWRFAPGAVQRSTHTRALSVRDEEVLHPAPIERTGRHPNEHRMQVESGASPMMKAPGAECLQGWSTSWSVTESIWATSTHQRVG